MSGIKPFISALSLAAIAFLVIPGCGRSAVGTSASDSSAKEIDHSQHQTSQVAVDPAQDKSAYLTQLWLIEGHLRAGTQLYAAGEAAMAATHMKHPEDELYADIKPAFAVYGASGFEGELRAIAADVVGAAETEIVQTHFADLRRAIADAAARAKPNFADELRAAAQTLRVAAEEYDHGVKDGAIVNIHEYQDAHGFTATIVERLTALTPTIPAEENAIAGALEAARTAAAVTPSVLPPAEITARSEIISEAATQIESIALSL